LILSHLRLQKTIPKDAKSLQIKSLQAFFYCIKAPYYAPKRNKNERNSVPATGQTPRTGLLLIN